MFTLRFEPFVSLFAIFLLKMVFEFSLRQTGIYKRRKHAWKYYQSSAIETEPLGLSSSTERTVNQTTSPGI
ncbi:MAG: hypothetical protein CMO12_04390 [Thaumarchaeota archaeon]|nr:hypothetical protein [Nitrososphaerota archaeon]